MYMKTGDHFNFYLPPRIIFGAGKRTAIADSASALALKNGLVVVDPFFVETDFFVEIIKGLETVGVKSAVWSDVIPDPTDVSVDDVVNTYRAADCDGIICIGGGSAMDTGKSAAVVIGSDADSIREFMYPVTAKITGMAPTICVPTTSGTGAEVNPYSMVTNTETGEKRIGYNAWEMVDCQKYAVVDPELTLSMPPGLTASTGLDAFCQALECFVTDNNNPISDDIALRAVSLAYENLRLAVNNGQDLQARIYMSMAAMMSTMAFPNAGLSYPHFLSETLAGVFHLQHGIAVGTVLVATLEELLPIKTDRLAHLARVIGVPTEGKSQQENAEMFVEQIRQLLIDIKFPTLTEAIGGQKADLDVVLDYLVGMKPHLDTPEQQKRIRNILSRSLKF